MKMVNLVYICVYLFISIAGLIICHKRKKILKVSIYEFCALYMASLVFYILITLFLLLMAYANKPIYEEYEESVLKIIQTSGVWIIDFCVKAICSPIIEEIIFRAGVMYMVNRMTSKTQLPYKNAFIILVSSSLFALMHESIIQKAYAFICGIVLGFIYIYKLEGKSLKKDENLTRSILFHIFFNTTSMISYLFCI